MEVAVPPARRVLGPLARPAWLPAWLPACAIGLSSLTVLAEPRDVLHPVIGLMEGALIASLAVAGALLVEDDTQRGNALLLWVVGALLAVEHLHLVPHSPFPMLGWVAGPAAAVVVAVVLVRFPGPTLSPRGRRWAGAALVVLVATRLTVSVPPQRLRLGWWPALPLPGAAAEAGLRFGNAYLLVLACWFVGLMAWRITRSRGLSRHELAPVVAASLGATLAIAAHVVSVFSGQTQVGLGVLVAEQVGLLAVPAGFVFAASRMRAARSAVGDLLLEVRSSSSPTQIEAALATTLSDPGLALHLWAAEEELFRTAGGQAQQPAPGPGRMVVPVDAEDGSPLAIIVTDASVARHGQLVQASVAAVRLALQNAAATEMLRRSRTRLAEAELAERKRLERDLHDGVQQRLLALGMSIDRVVHSAPDEQTRDLAKAAAEHVQGAIADVRDLARGVLPAVLTQSGLAAAVQSAAERLPVAITSSVPGRRWPLAVEATAYFVICEGLNNVVKHAGSLRAEVLVDSDEHVLTVTVRDAGRGGANVHGGSGLLGLRDRVAAMGGTISVDSVEGAGTCLVARLPYE
ncbi:sensor histidine kinase [Nocardioides mangrovicus]|uniref:sensor histidine kinase n=1 Tax=Nocardioides mangrovicus TaxID=2478913 RepID=UPI0011C456EE|nr:sensor histidine kinase [Nocardioides mangrovicus]